MNDASFVSDLMIIPEEYDTMSFHFCKLAPELTALDYEAVTIARKNIRDIYDISDPSEWPNDSLTYEDDYADLIHHCREFDERLAFAYSVLNLEKDKCLGCFYIDPCSRKEYDALITLWGLDRELTVQLYHDVKNFLDRFWSFTNPAFPAFEIPLSDWKSAVNPGVWD